MRKEERDLLSEAIQDGFQDLKRLSLDDSESKDWQTGVSGLVNLMEVANTADQIDEKWVDNAERRKIDEQKSKDLVEIETKKSKLTPGKVALELTKTLVPLGVSAGLYLIVHKENLKFEETGRFCSMTARDLHLPNFFKWR